MQKQRTKSQTKSQKRTETLMGYRDTIPEVTSRFVFDHHATIDKSGLIATPQGYARPFYHKPTNTVGLFFSKTANNLRGRSSNNGKTYATPDELARCYVLSVERCKSDSDMPLPKRLETRHIEKKLRHSLELFSREMRERNQKHFTGFVTENFFTNGRVTYEIVKKGPERFDVIRSLPTRRKDGSFMPFDLDDKSLRGYFSKLSTRIASTSTYEGARVALMKDWGRLSSELWDEKNIFDGKGKAVKAKKLMADFANATMDHAMTFGLTMLAVSGMTMAVKPSYTFVSSMIAALAHAAAHIAVERSLEETHLIRKRVKEARNRLNIEAYPFDADVSDHFKIQTAEEIAKHCPHLDTDRFPAEEFEFLDLSQLNLRRDREQLRRGLSAASLPGHLLFMHQSGFSSLCSLLDRSTEIRRFQTGIVRLMHEKENGNIVVYAQYRPELCVNEALRLPQSYIDQFNDGIVRLEYDRKKASFENGLVNSLTNVSYQDMITEIERECLFRDQTRLSWSDRQRSYQSLYYSFTDPDKPIKHDILRSPPPIPTVGALRP